MAEVGTDATTKPFRARGLDDGNRIRSSRDEFDGVQLVYFLNGRDLYFPNADLFRVRDERMKILALSLLEVLLRKAAKFIFTGCIK